MKKKTIALVMAVVLLMVATVGGTLAWLTAKSEVVTNTFTTSNIEVELKETTSNYQMVPGCDISKDPKATVKTGSEKCWLFVKIDKSTNFDDFMTYTIADGWTQVKGQSDVYARKVDGTTNAIGAAYSVLAGDKVTVKGEVTKAMMTADNFTQPTLTFTAYASQLYKNSSNEEFTAAQAWDNITDK